jgi:NADP-dependent 3-hydroxy acid dehydrogenase YdfG
VNSPLETHEAQNYYISLTEEWCVISFTFQSISPGVVKTDFLVSSGTSIITPDAMYSSNPYLLPKDIADAVLFALGCPPHVQVMLLRTHKIG